MSKLHMRGRKKIAPELAGYGIEALKDDVVDALVDDFNTTYRGTLAVDELLFQPREAIWFCDNVRRKHGWFSLTDEVILRWLFNRIKDS